MLVIKRDNSKEYFDINKIVNAVNKAFNSCGETMPDYMTALLHSVFSIISGDVISIEEIQDKVEDILMNNRHFKVAKAYIIYREKHREARFIKERIDYMNKYSQSTSNAATSSETDGNSNVSIKNVANLEGEVYKTTNRIIQRQRMKDKLNIMFPEVADQYEKDINHHIIYIHDEASTPVLKNYCMAVSLYPLMEHGTSTMDGLLASSPKNIDSFCGQFVNLVFLLSSQCKGAVGFGEFFNFFDYYCAKEWGDNYHLKEDVIIDADSKINKKTIGQKIEQYFQQIVYSMNQPAGNRSYQSPFTNFNYFDSNYWYSLFDDFIFPDGSKPVWERVSYLQKKFIKWFNKERTKTLLTYPVESMCLLHNGKDVLDKEYKKFAAEMWSEGHSFFMYLSDNPDAVASCCRLRNEVKNNTFSSTTGLTGVQTGSANVITLNLNRIIQDWARQPRKTIEDNNGILDKTVNTPHLTGFKEYLIDILERVYKYHIAYKTMLYELENQGMLTASKAGYISMRKLFSTIGVNGFNEAAEFLGMEISNNEKYKEFISFLFKTILDFCKEKSTPQFLFNLEVVPAESLGSKNYNWDKEDGYVVPSNRVLYNSYVYNAHNPNISVLDRFILQGGEIAKSCSGGQAVHCNLEDHLSKEQYLKLIEFAIAEGTNYFTFNIPNSQCDDCGFITKHPIKECPKCHSKNITQWTRTIGYLRPIKSMDYYRQIEASNRVYSNGKDEIKC
jgi:ribonucleoside-triphosphate reductase